MSELASRPAMTEAHNKCDTWRRNRPYRFIIIYTGFLGGVAGPHPADRAETGARLCSYGMTMGRGPNPVKIPIHDVKEQGHHIERIWNITRGGRPCRGHSVFVFAKSKLSPYSQPSLRTPVSYVSGLNIHPGNPGELPKP